MSHPISEPVASHSATDAAASSGVVCWRAIDPAHPGPRAALVAVHGTGGDGRSTLDDLFDHTAARLGAEAALVCPTFRTPYQYLLPDADRALLTALEANGLPTDRLLLYGFSGGAQFVHRFAMRHPRRVAACVALAAGCWTRPDGVSEGMQVEEDWFAQPPWDTPEIADALREPTTDPAALRRVAWLVGCGDRDHSARRRSAAAFHAALRAHGCAAEWVTWPGGHEGPPAEMLRTAFAFLARAHSTVARLDCSRVAFQEACPS